STACAMAADPKKATATAIPAILTDRDPEVATNPIAAKMTMGILTYETKIKPTPHRAPGRELRKQGSVAIAWSRDGANATTAKPSRKSGWERGRRTQTVSRMTAKFAPRPPRSKHGPTAPVGCAS